MIADIALRFFAVCGGGYIAWNLLSDSKDKKAYADRIARFVAPVRHSEVVSFSVIKASSKNSAPFLRNFLRWMNVDLSRLDQYPRIWPAIVASIILGCSLEAYLLSPIAGIPFSLLLMVVSAVCVTRMVFGSIMEKRRRLQLSQFPDAIGMMVRSLSVGISSQEAFSAVAREAPSPTGDEFRRYTAQIAMGVEMGDALRELADRAGLIEYRFFVTTLIIQARSGGRLSDTLDGLSDTIRKRIALRERGIALSAEARASAMVLAALPFMLQLILLFMNRDYSTTLFTDSIGKSLLVIGIGMLIVGFLIMREIIRKTLS